MEQYLKGGDLRSIGGSNKLVSKIQDQGTFDSLFQFLFHQDRLVVMRAADAVEKITLNHPEFLESHLSSLLDLCEKAHDKELKWHLALLIPRLSFSKKQLKTVWSILSIWATDQKESKIVRVNSLQGLHDLSSRDSTLRDEFDRIVKALKKENIPSINARIKKFY